MDAEQANGRSSGRAKPKKDYNGMNTGKINQEFSKSGVNFPTVQQKGGGPM